MAERPRIAVTRWDDVPPEARDRYWARIEEAGAEVVDFAEPAAGDEPRRIQGVDALMLTGGVDVDPSVYGAERHVKVKETEPGRDAMELACLRAALERDIPVLAICRGHQVLNVGFGGALLQHVESGAHRADFKAPGAPSRWHALEIEPDTRLSGILEARAVHVNSRHHQAVTPDVLAPGLRPVAYAADHGGTLIEGLESDHHAWVVGVQWHPERPEEHEPAFAPAMRRLFDAFIAQAAKVRA